MSRVLVTGATGFVGSLLCRRLVEKGHEVVAATRREMNIKGCHCLNIGSIDENTDWTVHLKSIDVIFHLAARVHVMNDGAEDPLKEFRRINVAGTKNLAEQFSKTKDKRFVFLSSIKVNGEKTKSGHPFNIEDTAAPQDPYGQSKQEAERVLRLIAQNSSLSTTILRPPLVYGPGVKANFLALLKLANSGLPVPFGCLNNKRSLIYVENLCDLLIKSAFAPQCANKTYLVSDGTDLSVKEMFSLMRQHFQKPPRSLPIPSSLLNLLGSLVGKKDKIHRLTQSLEIDMADLSKDLNLIAPYDTNEAFRQTCHWLKSQS